MADQTLVVEHQMSGEPKVENGVVFGGPSQIAFSCSYPMADQTLQSDALKVTSDEVSFDGMYIWPRGNMSVWKLMYLVLNFGL